MKRFDEYLYKYGFHDCSVNNILLQDNKICFCFDFGLYLLDSLGKESIKTPKCQMVIEIKDLNAKKMWEFIEINKAYNGKTKEVKYERLIKDLKKHKFDIEINYFSPFDNEILLEGYIENEKYQMKVSEITKIDFKFI